MKMQTAILLALLSATASAAPPDFATQVVPVLTRAGCNTGACHGAAIGRGGFRLSLLGQDPNADYDAIVEEFESRRVNLARPERSLLLAKPSMQSIHEGGLKLARNGEGFKLVRDWIAAGAPRGVGRVLRSIEIAPFDRALDKIGDSFAVRVTAVFADGGRDDVTKWALFTPVDPAALRVSAAGEVKALRRGQAAATVRFLGEVGCVTVTVPLTDDPPPANRPRTNFIDDQVNRTLDRLRLPHSPAADDAGLARRLHLDLIGTLPTPAEVAAFVADTRADKRQRLVEALLARPEFVDFWTYKWGDLLRIDSKKLGNEGAAAFHDHVRRRVAENAPLDKVAREMLLALGDAKTTGAVNFSRVPNDAGQHAEYVGATLMGVRIGCANCHNHPLDRWTQDDYHGLSAVFAKLARGPSVTLRPRGDVIHPKTGQPAIARIPGGDALAQPDARAAFADWLVDPKNPYFARAAVNRIWSELMGRGLVEPDDDHRSTNPPTHPELLAGLAADFVAGGFDVRRLIRTIVASDAYRRSCLAVGANAADDRFYSRAAVRRLPAPVLIDAVSAVAGAPEKLGELPPGSRAIALGDSRVLSEALDLAGRCKRDGTGCSSAAARGAAGSLPAALHAINGAWLNAKINDGKGRPAALIKAGKTDAEIVAEFYRLALGRAPTAEEAAHWNKQLSAAGPKGRVEALSDFVWALLNAVEFTTNH